jgi:diguanylate cyclase (GGDEF)-like protein
MVYVKKNGKDNYILYQDIKQNINIKSRIYEKNQDGVDVREEENSPGFDQFGFELMDLAFRLTEDMKDVQSAINLLIRKVALHYGMDVVSIRETINKPRTMRYMYEYTSTDRIPNRLDTEWQYSRDVWDTFMNHFEDGEYCYSNGEEPIDIKEVNPNGIEFHYFYEVPILRKGKIIGCIDYASLKKDFFLTAVDRNTLKMFTRIISSYMLNMRKYIETTEKIEELNDHDALTGLMKYDIFCKKLKKAIKNCSREEHIVVIYSDLKHFKYINETYGYDIGNKLLKKFCDKTTKDVKRLIGAARVYSDNIVLAASVPKEISEESIYKAVLQTCHKTELELQETFMDNNISICTGIFIIHNSQADVEIAVSNANMARKEAKKKDRNTVVLFNDNMMEKVVRQMQLNAELPEAIRNREITAYYQPKIESGTGMIVGGEALVRWRKQDGSFIYPDEFIPGFEENGMIVDVDFCVYDCVFQYIRERIDAGKPIVPISMNISSVHLRDDEFLPYIEYLFDKYRIPEEYVEFELTESIYIENLERALELIKALRSKGIKISMDDFGSGYSSLNVLNNLPIDVLKLDKIFLDGNALTVNQKIVISCIAEMASKLNIKVVCEGVETWEQVNFLTVIGCDMIQGYFYAKPMGRDDFSNYIDDHIKVESKYVEFSFDESLKDSSEDYEGYYIGKTLEFGPGPFVGSKALKIVEGEIASNVVDIPCESFPSGSYTINFWAKVEEKNMWSSVVYLEYENGFASIMPNAGDLKADFRIKSIDEPDDVWHDTGSVVSADNEWHFYAASYNAQSKVAIFYIDDIIAGYMENVDALKTIHRILIGGDIYTGAFTGLVSDLKIYNQSLSKTDIVSEYRKQENRLTAEARKGRKIRSKLYGHC